MSPPLYENENFSDFWLRLWLSFGAYVREIIIPLFPVPLLLGARGHALEHLTVQTLRLSSTSAAAEAYTSKEFTAGNKTIKQLAVSLNTSIPGGHIQCLMRYLVANGPRVSLNYKADINHNNKLWIINNFPFSLILFWSSFKLVPVDISSQLPTFNALIAVFLRQLKGIKV